MDGRFEDLRSTRNSKTRIKIMKGHFATSNSHLNTYIDMSTIKTRHNNARETAKELAGEYLTNTFVNTVVCLDETEVIGTFLAEHLADSSQLSLSAGNNISVLRSVGDGVSHSREAGFVDQIYDQLHLMYTLKVRVSWIVSRFYQCVEACLH